MRILLNLILGLVMVAYPFLVYWGLTSFQPRMLALMLAGLVGLRFLLLGKDVRKIGGSMVPMIGAVSLTVLLVFVFGKSEFLFLNPVFINIVFLVTFGLTLRNPPSMIERFARIRHSDLPPEAVPYCRKVTMVWCGFFVINAGIALWTALMCSVATWTLYNGLISYLLMGALFGGEMIVRIFHMRAVARKNGNTLA